jgi:hypothetical protein
MISITQASSTSEQTVLPLNSSWQLDREREVIKEGPMFVRIKLALSEKKKREPEVYRQIELEKKMDTNPIELKPNSWGFGIDLFKMFHIIKNWLNKRHDSEKSPDA